MERRKKKKHRLIKASIRGRQLSYKDICLRRCFPNLIWFLLQWKVCLFFHFSICEAGKWKIALGRSLATLAWNFYQIACFTTPRRKKKGETNHWEGTRQKSTSSSFRKKLVVRFVVAQASTIKKLRNKSKESYGIASVLCSFFPTFTSTLHLMRCSLFACSYVFAYTAQLSTSTFQL